MNDEIIVDLYLTKDENAITRTKEIYGKKLNLLSLNIVRSQEDADECESDTYLKAWNSIPPQKPKTYLFSFLAKITRNLSINTYNKYHTNKRFAHIVELTREMEECLPNPNDEEMIISESELMKSVNNFLFSLNQLERELFIKRYWYAFSINDLSVSYKFTQSKVKSMLMRTRNKMKKHFESEGLNL